MTTARTLTISLLDENNKPLEGGTIRIQLVGYDLDPEGVVFPDETVTVTTDENGEAQVDLWPNEVGTTGSYYRLRAITGAGRKVLDVIFMMPDRDETLRWILANNAFTDQEAALLLERFAKVFMQWKGEFDLANGLPENPKHGDAWKATGTGDIQVQGAPLEKESVIVWNGNLGQWQFLVDSNSEALENLEQNLTDHLNADDPHGVLARHTDQTENPNPHPQYLDADHTDPGVSPDPHPQYLTPDENRPTVDAGELVSSDHPYTYGLNDEDNLRKHNTSTDVTCIVPHDDNIDFPLGATIPGKQVGGGRVSWQGESMNGTTVQVDYAQGRQRTRAPGAPYLLLKEGPNHWVVWGDLA